MKIQRLIAILTSLLQTDRIPATRLAEMFEVSVRTIYRDIDDLGSAGIPIVTYTGVNGGVGILEQYKIDKKLFTNQDITTLLTSLHSVSGSISDATLNQTLEKIKALIPAEQGRAIELSSRRLYIDLSPWANNPTLSENLTRIQKALEGNVLVTFQYTSLKQISSERTVEPHQLVLKENNWYLRAFCRSRQDFRVFKLRRMRGIHLLSETFEPRDFSSEMSDFKDWTHENKIVIDIVIDENLKDYMLEKCREEDMIPLENGKIHVRLPFVESDLGYGFLMQYGDKCECIGPDHVRQELMRRIDLLRAVYWNKDFCL